MFSIRRSSQFRFDYFLKSLPIEQTGKRCEQLMRAARKKEVKHMEKQAIEEAEAEGHTLPRKANVLTELSGNRRLQIHIQVAADNGTRI